MKTAIVTGVAGGIGKASALALAKNGYTVVGMGRSEHPDLSDFEGVLRDGGDMLSELETRKIGEIINSYLSGVSDRDFYIFMSRYYFSAPRDQIAKKVGMSLSSLDRILTSMKAELRALLEKGGVAV